MTFSCPNYDFHTEECKRVKKKCVPGRPGCVLEGKVKFSVDVATRIKEAEETPAKTTQEGRSTLLSSEKKE